MKKGFLFIIALVFAFFAFCGFYAKADAITLTMVNGAQVRTTGDYQGLRFEASVDTLEGASEHGFYIALGEHSLSDMRTAIEADSATVGTNKLVKKQALGEETTFAVTIYDITEEYYTAGITAVAYVKVGDDYTIDKVVTKNIAEVTMSALNAGETAPLLTTVSTYLSNNYMVKASGLNIFNEYTITPLVTTKWGYSNLDDLYAEFIADYNAAVGASLTTSSTLTQIHTSFKTGLSANTERDMSASNLAKFLRGANFVKWSWLIEYFRAHGNGVHNINQATALLRADRTCQSYDGHTFRHLTGSIYNFFNGTHEMVSGMASNDFTGGESAYANITWPSVTDFSSANIVSIGNNITLPAAPSKTGYTFDNYTDETNEFNPGDTISVTSTPKTIKSEFTPINYTITYNLNGGTNSLSNPANYNIESATIILQDASKTNFLFGGWYEESDFSGGAVTTIAKGSYGAVTLYAKWVEPTPVALSVGSVDITRLNANTPDIIVKSGLDAGKYYLDGAGLDSSYATNYYLTGAKAFASISDAIAAASANDTIYVFAGTYADAFTVNTNGITIIGANPELVLDHAGSYTPTAADKTNITGKITVSANDFTLTNVVVSNQISMSTGKSNITLEEIALNSTSNEPITVPGGASVTNLTIDRMLVVGNGARTVYIYGNLTNLSVNKLVVLDSVTGLYDCIRASNATEARLYGDISITNCYIHCLQSAFHDRVASGDTYTFTNNYFYDMPCAIFIRSSSTKANITYNILYNTFNSCLKADKAWDVIEMDQTVSKNAEIHYNVFINSGTRANCNTIQFSSTAGTIDCSNNYLAAAADRVVTNAVGLTDWELEEATTTANTYDDYKVVEIGGKYYIYGINLTTD